MSYRSPNEMTHNEQPHQGNLFKFKIRTFERGRVGGSLTINNFIFFSTAKTPIPPFVPASCLLSFRPFYEINLLYKKGLFGHDQQQFLIVNYVFPFLNYISSFFFTLLLRFLTDRDRKVTLIIFIDQEFYFLGWNFVWMDQLRNPL